MTNAAKLLATIVTLIATSISGCSVNTGAHDDSCLVRVNGVEPEATFSPLSTTDSAGLRIASVLHSGLVYVDATGEPQLDLAKEITRLTETSYEVVLREELQFSDGTPITAHNFVDTWKFIVAEELVWAPLFEFVAGFADDTAVLSGLTIVNDQTFRIELAAPRSDFLALLAHPALVPLPKESLQTETTPSDQPVVSGPYMVDRWVHSQFVTVVPNAHYGGTQMVKNEGIAFHMAEGTEKPFTDFRAGDLDVLDDIPVSEVEDYRETTTDRYIHQPGAAVVTLSIHADTPHFSGEEGRLRRQAISLAIDRESLAENVLDNSHLPAGSFVPPLVPGALAAEAEAETVGFNPEAAVELWRQADAISPFTGVIPVHFNSDLSDNHDWGPTVARQVSQVLGVQAEPVPGGDYVRFHYDFNDVRFDGLYRTGWMSDYPSMRNYLVPNFATGGESNETNYSNEEVDRLFTEADHAVTVDEALHLYGQAEAILLDELPAIPLLFPAVNIGWNETVTGVASGFNSFPIYSLIGKDQSNCQ